MIKKSLGQKEILGKKRKRLFAGTLPANKNLFAGTLPANKNLFAGTLPANKNLFAGTVPANKNLFAGTPQVGSIFTFYPRNGFFSRKK